jgi:Tfp pilus assembly protein PilF
LLASLEKAGRATEAAAVREECATENCGASAALAAALRETAGSSGPDRFLKLERISTALDTSALLFAYRAAHEGNGTGPRPREHFEIHLARGRKALAEGQLEAAQRDFAEAVLLAPDSAESRIALAEVYQRSNRLEDAERELRAALWGRENADVRVSLARLYVARGKSAEARTELRAVLRVQPTHSEARRLLDSLAAPVGSQR